ncbi:gluconate 2-dehydrogenase subunit 3 family protein [Pedobacter gandavensis]|uniref:gluconate 2-dehydrogenase subunit 3 family protein n=1 Tax=Pedobacter gandavensis TaxID=2679963 RepID=UPI00292F1032|nr:gluconate 2-dehydrogenase subunit 3 family protein [Pedobacter gandavensis]
MNRRDAVKNVAFLMGGALSATTIAVFLDSCTSTSNKSAANLLSADHEKVITEVADIIIPTTTTPGAKAAGVGPFIAMMVKECYPEDAQKAFVKGLEDLEQQSQDTFKKSFLEISVPQRQELLNKVRETTIAANKTEKEALEKQQENVTQKKSEKEAPGNAMTPKDKPKTTPQFFAIIRDLTLLGYFTSEIGATKAMAYVEIPGRYDGDVPLKPGQKVWS